MTKIINQVSAGPRFLAFERAREAMSTLLALKKILTPSELETLEILLDRKSSEQLSKSLKEAREGKIEPIKTMLE